MKKIIILLVFLLLAGTATAQLDINIIQYDSESENSRIQIHNIGDENYRNLTFAVDDGEPEKLVDLLKKKTAIVTLRIIPPGEHNITIVTEKGYIFSKKLNFAKSEATIKDELEQEKEARLKKEEKLKEIPSLPSAMPEPKEKLPKKKILTIFIVGLSAILFLILLVKLILNYKRSEKEKPRSTQRPVYARPVVRQLTPGQRRMQIELIKKREAEKERKRREIIESLRRK